jgi:TonB family protein
VPDGILVDGNRYDVIQMEWINGSLLNDHLDTLLEDGQTSEVVKLADALFDLGLRLEKLGVAHGDIQHGNVLVDEARNLRLVDYDDMFLPTLAHLEFPSGIGHENYQHPGRGSKHYDAKLDRFAFISIYVTLLALALRPALREEGDGDCLLFRKADFLNPYESKIFAELDSVERVKELIDRFSSICVGAYEDVPSLIEFIDGRFQYTRFAPKLVTTRPAVIPDTTPFPMRPDALSPPLPASWAAQGRWGLTFTIAAVASACLIIVVMLGLFGRRPRHTVASHQIVTSHAAHLHSVARGLSPPHEVVQHARPATTVHHPIAVQQAPSHHAERAKSAVSAFRHNVLTATREATPKPAPRRTAIPASAIAAATELPQIATALPSGPGQEAQNTCSTPNAPAHLVSLAAPEISNEKRTTSTGKHVTVTVNVQADGSVTDAYIKESAEDVALDFAALGVARKSTYAAAQASCAAAAGTVDVTVTY